MTVRREIDLNDPDWWHKEALRLYEENDQLRREIEKSEKKAEWRIEKLRSDAMQEVAAAHQHYKKLSSAEHLNAIEGQNAQLRKEIEDVRRINCELREKIDELGEANGNLIKAYGVREGSPKPSPLRMRSFGLFTMWKEFGRADD